MGEKPMNRVLLFISTLSLFLGAMPASALEVGEFGPCVVLEDIQVDGSSKEQCIRTPRKKGQFVLLEFFSPVCEDCIENLPALSELAADINARATTRLIGVDKSKQALLDFIHEHKANITVPVSLDTDRAAMKTYGVTSVPVLFILNSKNYIVYRHSGPLTPEAVEAIKKIVQ